DPRPGRCSGVRAGKLAGARPRDGRQSIYRPQSDAAPGQPEAGSMEVYPPGEADAAHPTGYSGRGMNSLSSPGTISKRRAFHSALACSMRSLREETKFHQMWRGPSIAAPPRRTTRAVVAAVAGDDRQVGLVVMGEARRDLLVARRHRDPALQPVQALAAAPPLGRGALRMHDAAARGHQVDVAGMDRSGGAEAVAMHDLAVE